MNLRLLTRDEVELIWTIDRSEIHTHIYKLSEGQLVRTPTDREHDRLLLQSRLRSRA